MLLHVPPMCLKSNKYYHILILFTTLANLQVALLYSCESFCSKFLINYAYKFLIAYILYFYGFCRVTNCSSNPNGIGYEPNEPNTINL